MSWRPAVCPVGIPYRKPLKDVAVVERVLTEPEDRITTGELFPVIEDLASIQDYMSDNMRLMKTKIDLEEFVDTQFAKAAGAK